MEALRGTRDSTHPTKGKHVKTHQCLTGPYIAETSPCGSISPRREREFRRNSPTCWSASYVAKASPAQWSALGTDNHPDSPFATPELLTLLRTIGFVARLGEQPAAKPGDRQRNRGDDHHGGGFWNRRGRDVLPGGANAELVEVDGDRRLQVLPMANQGEAVMLFTSSAPVPNAFTAA